MVVKGLRVTVALSLLGLTIFGYRHRLLMHKSTDPPIGESIMTL